MDINYVEITWTETTRANSEFENLKFFIYFLNKDISFNISFICLKLSMYVDKGHSEGRVSQFFFYLGPSFYFIKSRKLSFKN